MAIHTTSVKFAYYSCKLGKASHIFLKKGFSEFGKYQVTAFWQIRHIWLIFNLGHLMYKNRFVFVYNNLVYPCQIC